MTMNQEPSAPNDDIATILEDNTKKLQELADKPVLLPGIRVARDLRLGFED